tara:strand:+ start:626 stop:850 length:225 start_codon:yes stop_codon:yes gene_type:complete
MNRTYNHDRVQAILARDFNEGFNAARMCTDYLDNPHPSNSLREHEWHRGYERFAMLVADATANRQAAINELATS